MKDRADYARKGIARGRALVGRAATTTASCSAPRTRRHPAQGQRDLRPHRLRRRRQVQRVRPAAHRRRRARRPQGLRLQPRGRRRPQPGQPVRPDPRQVFTHEMKPMEVEILVAEVGADRRGRPALPHPLRRHRRRRATASRVLGGEAEAIAAPARGRAAAAGARTSAPRSEAACRRPGRPDRAARRRTSSRWRCSTATARRRAFRRLDGRRGRRRCSPPPTRATAPVESSEPTTGRRRTDDVATTSSTATAVTGRASRARAGSSSSPTRRPSSRTASTSSASEQLAGRRSRSSSVDQDLDVRPSGRGRRRCPGADVTMPSEPEAGGDHLGVEGPSARSTGTIRSHLHAAGYPAAVPRTDGRVGTVPRGPADLRPRERVRRHLHPPGPAPAEPRRGGPLPVPPGGVAGAAAATSSSRTAPASTSTSAATPSTPRPSATRSTTSSSTTRRASASSSSCCTFAEQRLREEGIRGVIYLFKNNTDSAGNSYGCHENYLTSRRDDFGHYAEVLIPFLVSRQIYAGAGKVLQTARGAMYCITPAGRAHLGGRLQRHHPQPPDHQHPRRAPRRRRALPPPPRHRGRLEHERVRHLPQGRAPRRSCCACSRTRRWCCGT